MTNPAFETEVFGKFIVAGEHAVLRGAKALAFPYFAKSFKLRFEPARQPLEIRSSGGEQESRVFSVVLEKALSLLEHRRDELSGTLFLENTIPVGAGLGASAALCVSVARLAVGKGWLRPERLQEFSRELENIFHGESSGVDIAVALTGKPIIFERGHQPEVFQPRWQPDWGLSYCGHRGMTIDTIRQVQLLAETDPDLFQQIDLMMSGSSLGAIEALKMERVEGLVRLKAAMQLAAQCFQKWNLTTGRLAEQIDLVIEQGALAAKPTGSGAGGYVLSLWDGKHSISPGVVPEMHT